LNGLIMASIFFIALPQFGLLARCRTLSPLPNCRSHASFVDREIIRYIN
jgi:hypothetical protein